MRLRKANRTKYKVSLTPQEREHLQRIIQEGTPSGTMFVPTFSQLSLWKRQN